VPPWLVEFGSPSLQRSLIDATNLLFLLCYCVSLVLASYRKEFTNVRRNVRWLSVLSSLCCAILAIFEVGSGCWVLFKGECQYWDWLIPFLRGIIWVFLAVSFIIQPNKFARVLCTIWWVAFAVLTFAFNLETIIRKNNLEIVDLTSWPVCLLFLVCAMTLRQKTNPNQDSTKENLSEPLLQTKNEKETNFSRAGFHSRLFFFWMNPLLKLGYSKPLKQTDIPLLDPDDGAQEACQRFLMEWNNSKTKTAFYVLFKCFRRDFILTGIYALLRTLAFAASPLLLHAFVLYSYKEEKDLYEGFILIVYLILMKIVESLSQRHWFFGSKRLGMKMRSALMAAIFQKQLKLSNNGRRWHSAGEVVNYIAVDAYKLGEFPFWLHLGWSQPIQLVLAIAILFCTVGLGTVPGMIPLVVCALLNIPFAKLLQFYQSKFMVTQDARQRATSEVLNNMKIIKLQSWDEKFKEKVQVLRDAEVDWLKETQIKKAYGSALYWMSPTFVSAVIFAGTAALNTAPLNADVVFTILATLRVMCEPMRMVPEALSILIQVKVSLDRIGAFLVAEELREEDVTWVREDNFSEAAVSVTNGEFSWSTTGDILHLKGVNLKIKKGEKVAVCGPVGAGKSSLLCAILGEIPKISGSVRSSK
jgi:ATP-binding cassette, subfamily C (CFTR/MRP), member 1